MEIKVVGHSSSGSNISKNDILVSAGLDAGICYMPDSWETLSQEDSKKTFSRIERNISGEHHSVFDHYYVNLILEDIPKLLAMLLNNQKIYATSEKSARYTKMVLSEQEQIIYNKWFVVFLDLINKKYPMEKYNNCAYWGMTEKANISKRTKLAQENARYLTSVFTPTTMAYSVSIRQLNYLYNFLADIVNNETTSELMNKAKPYIEEFLTKFDKELIIDKLNAKSKSSSLSFIDKRNYEPTEIYDDIYQTNYLGSLAELAQAQRHRTINYTIKELPIKKYFVPPILWEDDALMHDYLNDLERLEKGIPQATYVKIYENGTLDNLILKAKERKCSYAQLEINNKTDSLIKRYIASLREKDHPRAEELAQYDKGARCTFPDYKCSSPCGFVEGVKMDRII